MTREEILKAYKVRKGTIRSLGQFEGERIYVPYFWSAFLDGVADFDDGQVVGFYVTPEDKAEFPELKRRKTVKLAQTDQGFIIEVR